MRLHYGYDVSAFGLTGGFQRRDDLERIMGVIVDDRDAVPFADLGEAPIDAAKLPSARRMVSIGYAQFARHRERGQRILHIVLARHRQAEIFEARFDALEPIGEHHVEMRGAFGEPT